MREGRPLPNKIQNAPELALGLQFYYSAWTELGRDRPIGFGGEGPIPLGSVYAYALYNELNEEELEDLIYFTALLDAEYIKWNAKKRGGGNGKPGGVRSPDPNSR